MTAPNPEPLSTDRCRELAVAVFSYRPSLVAKSRARSALFAAAAEIDQLRALLENAPHDETCQWNWPCTCWKSDTL